MILPLILGMLVLPVFPQDEPPPTTGDVSEERSQDSLLLLTSEEPLDGHLRQQIAVELLERMKIIDDPIPTLSPSERRWLEIEREASKNNVDRLVNMLRSKESSLEKAKHGSSQLVLGLRGIVGGANDTKEEVLLWTMVSYHFVDQMFWEALNDLVERKLVVSQSFVDELDWADLYTSWGGDILEKIVMPFLHGTLPE